ncbi:MAG: hypothetical protein ACYTA3_01385 [Planctomycetota bacterium]|jgi:hypothetical protein
MSYEGKDLVRAFFFGLRLAEHFHDVPYAFDEGQTDRIVRLLKSIADGDFTLVDSPEEVADQADWHPQLRERLPEMLSAARRHHRMTAADLLSVLRNLPGSPWQA